MPLLSARVLGDDHDNVVRRMKTMADEIISFESHYKELAEYTSPRRGRFFIEDANIGDKRYKSIINNRASSALRKSTAGLFAGALSPARPWFAWDMLDKDIKNSPEVKIWLALFQKIILLVFAKSNFYNMAPTMLKELLLFATGCMTHEDDFEDVARFYTHTVGSYTLSQNDKLTVDTLGRKVQMTVRQMVNKFGEKNVSQAVLNQYENKDFEAKRTVNHLIEPNPYRDISNIGSEFLPYRSVYFEDGSVKNTGDRGKFLRRRGFKGFPVYAPRWETTGEDLYGTSCPGMINLGDIKQLQSQELEKGKGIAKSFTPPLQAPPALRNTQINNLPGGVTPTSSTGTGKIEPLYQVTPDLRGLIQDIEMTQERIDEEYFVPLFMAITDIKGIQPKNQLQLSQVNEERLLQLGPVLEQIHGEWLDKAVRKTAKQILEAGIMPEAPRELQGHELEVEFISALAMAQRTIGVSNIERTMQFGGSLTEAGWDVSDKLDGDMALELHTELLGTDPRIIVPDAIVAERRQEKADAQAQATQLAQASEAAGMMQAASQADLGGDNALSRFVNRGSQ